MPGAGDVAVSQINVPALSGHHSWWGVQGVGMRDSMFGLSNWIDDGVIY